MKSLQIVSFLDMMFYINVLWQTYVSALIRSIGICPSVRTKVDLGTSYILHL